MPASSLLVPLKLEALVIDDRVIEEFGFARHATSGRVVAGDGKWTPTGSDYGPTIRKLDPVGPKPFFGAQPSPSGTVLGFDEHAPPAPRKSDRGVHLRWILPPGLRHGGTDLNYPSLPDQWLVVRFARRPAATTSRAWFIDSGLPAENGAPNLVVLRQQDGQTRPQAQRFGRVFSLENGTPPDAAGPRAKFNAIGNAMTGSRWFSAFTADNRNALSFFDDLADWRTDGSGAVPADLSVSYLVVGWFAEAGDEPLRAVMRAGATAAEIQQALADLQWTLDAAPPIAGRCYFHGLLAHLNFWNPDTYKGAFLGYPGAHAQHGGDRRSRPPLKIGFGFSAIDALTALLADGDDRTNGTALWQALEAVAFHQPQTLLDGADPTPLEQAKQAASFHTLDSGLQWSIHANERAPGTPLSGGPHQPETGPAPEPTPEQLAQLGALNTTQRQADADARDLAGLQQAFHTHWWTLCRAAATQRWNLWKTAEAACAELSPRITELQSRLQKHGADLARQLDRLRTALVGSPLELKAGPAPRFWTPSDPVLLISNYGQRERHAFPASLPVRPADQLVDRAQVIVDATAHDPIAPPTIGAELQAVMEGFLSAEVMGLVEESRQLEAAFTTFATRALPSHQPVFRDEDSWTAWTERLDHAIHREPRPAAPDKLIFQSGNKEVAPWRLLSPWQRQPWSPLFLDWQVTWHPADFDEAPDPAQPGHTFRGRSQMAPIDSAFFRAPMEDLMTLLQKEERDELVAVMDRHLASWRNALDRLHQGGLLGQTLEGFHQALAGREACLPRIQPNPQVPWNHDPESKFTDKPAADLLQPAAYQPEQAPLSLPAQAPPARTPPTPFDLRRAGSFTIDHLWLIDDFGQWVDLLQGSTAGRSSGLALHPQLQRRVRGEDRIAVPPCLLQPARLQFRFTRAGATDRECCDSSAESPVYGWVFYHLLDDALAVCDGRGRLIGELLEQDNAPATWRDYDDRTGPEVTDIAEPNLRAFVQGLTPPGALAAFLELVDWGLDRCRPAQARNRERLGGRPLALVGARLGLELFGETWRDPATGHVDSAFAALTRPVRLGRAENSEDGLMGFYTANAPDRIVPGWAASPFPDRGAPYIATSAARTLRVGFSPVDLVLLMDPNGAVNAETDILPGKSITLPPAILQSALAHLETSFQVGPVLLPAGATALPLPQGDKGQWHFDDGSTVTPVTGLNPGPDSAGHRPRVASGRLVLERNPSTPS